MPKEYRTIQEGRRPADACKRRRGRDVPELGEIELASGEIRRCRVLEIDGSDALVQLFENSAGINIADSKVRFWAAGLSLACRPTCSAAFSTVWDDRLTAARRLFRKSGSISTVCRSIRQRATTRTSLSRRA